MQGRRIAHPRGKVLGGSSSINGMIFQRGNPLDYERWAADPGMQTWDYAHCLPYFKRMETCLAGADAWRGGERAARARARARDEPAVRCVFCRGRSGRLPAHRRRQRVPAGRFCEVRPQHSSWTPAERRARLPASGHAPPEPHRTHAGARDVGEVRGSAGGRRRVRADRKRAPLGPRRRSDSLRWRHQYAADTAALRRRERALTRVLRHSRRRGPAGRRRQPAGSSRGVRPVREPPAGVGRSRNLVAEEARCRRAVVAATQGARGDEPLRRRRLLPQQRGRRLSEPDVSLPADGDPLRRLEARCRSRLPGARGTDVLRCARLDPHPVQGSDAASGIAVQLPVHGPGPTRMGGGDPHRAPDTESACDGSLTTAGRFRRVLPSRPMPRYSTGYAAMPRPRCIRPAPRRWVWARMRCSILLRCACTGSREYASSMRALFPTSRTATRMRPS